MENASKALIMAGGILISVLIISLFIYMFTSMSSIYQTEEQAKRLQEIEDYNKQYISYNRKLLRGADIISLINKAISNNKKYDSEDYFMTIEFEMKEAMVYTKTGSNSNIQFEVGKTYNMNSFNSIRNNQDAFNDFKRRVFDCSEVEYNKAGLIYKMKFIERKIDYTEGL